MLTKWSRVIYLPKWHTEFLGILPTIAFELNKNNLSFSNGKTQGLRVYRLFY